ncbi:MAG: cysteine hydrolase [Chloroflexi bacterium]|nr:cysteine hydrolase [Chloroflexota bacterium]
MTQQLSISRHKIAVLIMDYQNRQVGSLAEDVREELLRKANEVLAEARSTGIPVIYVEGVRGERTPEREIHSSVTPKAGEVVVTKSRTGPFSTTEIDEVLKKQGIETLALMGISTSGCVLTTVRWASDIDYKLVVLSDCCADQDDEVQRVLMEKLFPRQATVASSEEFILALGKA